MVEILIDIGKVDVDARDDDGRTPLHLASQFGENYYANFFSAIYVKTNICKRERKMIEFPFNIFI